MRGLILVARHPRPRIAGRICYGRTDVPLAEPAALGAAALIAAAVDPIERIVSSPSSRALLVAREVARETGAPLRSDDRLLEMDFGVWEGRPWAALPRAEIDAWAADPIGYGVPGGESVAAMLLRVRRAWTGIASAEANTLVLCHAGPIRCLLHIAGGMPLPDAVQASVPYGSVTRFPP